MKDIFTAFTVVLMIVVGFYAFQILVLITVGYAVYLFLIKKEEIVSKFKEDTDGA